MLAIEIDDIPADTTYFDVIVHPAPEFSAGENESIFHGMYTTLSGAFPDDTSEFPVQWEPAALLEDPDSPTPQTVNLTETTTFTLSATGANSGCEFIDDVIIEVTGTALTTDILPDDQAICSDENITLTTNTSGGAEEYSYSWSSDPPGFSSTQTSPEVSPNQTTTYTVTVDDGYNEVTDEITLTVTTAPDFDAGPDEVTFCGESYRLSDAYADHVDSIFWETNGDGAFSMFTLEKPRYYPQGNDWENGQVTLTMNVDGNGACTDDYSDEITLFFAQEPTADAGDDFDICQPGEVPIDDAAFTNASALLWETSGTGSFDDNAIAQPVYTPSEEDFNNGSVVITATASNPPCDDVVATKTLNLYTLPEVSVGADDTVCETAPVFPLGQASDYSSLQWTSSGSGTFTDATVEEPEYMPSSEDINSGQVTLYLEAFTDAPCEGDFTDSLTLNIRKEVQLSAGADSSLCGPVDHVIVHSFAENYDSLLWTTSGSGTFSENVPNPVFTPTPEDVEEGIIQLSLTGSNAVCPEVSDTMEIALYIIPLIYMAEDTTICSTEVLYLDNTEVQHYLTITWQTNGTGHFSDANAMKPVYTPSENDIDNGQVILTCAADTATACEGPFFEQMTVNIVKRPEVTVQEQLSLCGVQEHTIPQAEALHATDVNWTTSGTGALDNETSLSPSYTPSEADMDDGEVELYLTASNGACQDVLDTVSVSLFRTPLVETETEQFICSDEVYETSPPTAEHFSTLQWQGGDGSFDNPSQLLTSYTPGSGDINSGQATLALELFSDASCEGPYQDSFTLNIAKKPAVDAGPDTTVCEQIAHVVPAALAQDYDSLIWKSSGTGTWSQQNSAAGVYTPSDADIAGGQVALSLEAHKEHCSVVIDTRTVSLFPEPVVETEPEQFICSDEVYETNPPMAEHFSTLQWQGGDGSFDNPSQLLTSYTPGSGDINSGQATLALELFSDASCEGPYQDSFTLNVSKKPTVDAGPDTTVCEQIAHVVPAALAQDYDSLIWKSSGTGTWSQQNSEAGIYTPSDADISSGQVVLSLEAHKEHCSVVVDERLVSLTMPPVVEAGNDGEVVCGSETFTVSDATASGYSLLAWSSSGDGAFVSGQNGLSPVYEPGTEDAANGQVVLTLEAFTENPCQGTFTDTRTVNIAQSPVINTGTATQVCQGDTLLVQGASIVDYDAFLWVSQGDGAFVDNQVMNPQYIPGTMDGVNEQVTLVLSASNGPCTGITEQLAVDVVPQPVAFAGQDTVVDPGTEYAIDDAEVDHYSAFLWTTDGSGTFSNPTSPNPVYTPSFMDSVRRFVNLTLTAQPMQGCDEPVADQIKIAYGANAFVDFFYTSPCEDTPIQFTVDTLFTDTENVTDYLWDFGNGETSSMMNPVYTYPVPGSYPVTLSVTDTVGDVYSETKMLQVAELPQPFFNTDAPSCSGSAVQFTDYTNTPSGYATSWHWDFGDGSDTLIDFPDSPHVTHAYALAGTYEATLTVETNLGCVNDYTREVTVHPSPITLFTWEAACGGQPTPFTDLSVENGGGDIIAWYWHFDNPESGTANTSEAQHPEHTFTGAGSYDVQLVTENIHGCTDTLIQPVEVTEGPAVAFTYDSTCFEQLSTFTADASVMDTAAIGTWLWEFGDGYSSNDPVSVQHLYNVPGDYSVTLTVTDTLGCTSSLTQTVQVLPLPMAQFGYDQPACFGNSVLFDDYSTTEEGYITTWHYAFGDGSDTTINHPENPNISHDYATPGDYEATLTVTSSTGCQDEITHTVTVEPIPEVNFDYSLACQSTAVEFEDLTQEAGSGDILAWHWNFGDPLSGANNTSSQQHPDHVYSTPGDYAVTLTVETANGCSDSLSQTVTVSPAPEVGFVYTASCLNDTVDFVSSTEVDTDAIISYAWSFGDGGTASGADPQHIYTQEGTYEVSLTVTDTTGCSNTATETLTITPLPVAAFSFTTNTCANESVMFQDASYAEGEALVSWTWEFGDGSDTTIQSPDIPDVEHAYPDAGTYEASLTVVTENGCSHTTSHTVEVLQIPAAQYSFEGGCQNEAVSFTDASQPNGGGQIASWSWNFDDPTTGGDNTSSLPNPAHFFSEADTFDVQLVVGNLNGCTDTVMHAVGVADAPEVGILAPDALCQGQPAMFMPDTTIVDTLAAQVYEWTFGDGSDPVYQQEASHTYTLAGTYTVTLSVTDTTGCVNQAQTTVQVGQTPVPVFDYQAACLGGETQFTDLSYTPGGEPVTSWYWDFGDPYADSADNHSSLQHPVHVYPVDSTYEVKLVVQTTGGCTDSIVSEVEVRPVPDAWFSYDTTACQGGQVQFYDSSFSDNSAVTAWQWTFEEGYTSDLQNPSYTFGEVGETYPVELVAYDAFGCSDTTIREVTIPEGFAVDFEFTSTCLGDTTFFTDSLVSPEGDSVIAVQWTFGDPGSGGANVSDQHNPEHYYSQPGTYNVTLEATNENYCTTTVSHALQVHALPEPDFTWQSYPCDSAVYVSDATTTAGVITQWIWHWGDGSSDVIAQGEDPDISHVYEQAGSYEVTLEVQNSNGCVNTFSQQVYREPCVAAEIVLQSDTLCHGDELVFADSSQIQEVIESWTWNFGDGSSEITYNTYQPEISHTFPNTGSYQVTLTVAAMFDGQMREHTDTLAVVIHPVPEAEFTWTEGCLNQPVAFGDSTSAEDAVITSWRWDFGEESLEADTSRQQHPEWGYSTFGEHEVVLQVMNEFGCRDTVQEPITVYRVPEAVIGHDSSCYMQPTQFYDLSDTNEFTGEIISWQWDFGVEGTAADTAVIAEPEYMYVNQDSRTVTLQVEDEFGCGDTTQKVVTTHPVPEAVFEVEENFEDMQGRFAMNNVSEGAVDYQWDFDRYSNGAHPLDYHYDAEYHEQERPVIVFEEDGYFELELVAFNEFNCPDTMRVVDSMLFKGLFVPNAFSPNNPHGEVQRFKPAGINLETYHMQVYDVKGNLLWETRELDDEGSPAQGWDGTYDGAPLPQGVYVWKAEAMFEDGTVWQGDEVGSSELSSGKRYGTVVIIR